MTKKENLIVYQVYPRSFKDGNNDGIGDLQGLIEKIPYLKSLGINALWLSPVYESPMDDNGYDISNYYNIHPEYGTLLQMKELIQTLHNHEIKLIMDLVINHTSDEHPWFIESRSSLDNPKRDYYIWREGQKNNKKAPNNWTSFFTGKAWTYDETTKMYYLHLFSKKQPDLNWENEEVRAELKKMITFWIELGVDGFRLDVINLISKVKGLPNGKPRLALTGIEHYANGPKVHQYIQDLNQSLFKKHHITTVGETVFVTPEDALLYVDERRNELDMLFHFEHMSVDTINNKWFIRKFKPRRLKKVLNRWQMALNEFGWNALYLENHDQPRSVSRFGNDQKYHKESAKMLATLIFLQRGTPYIYQGQEIGMTNANFENLDQYRDIETFNIYKIGREVLKFTHHRMMKKIKYMSRDNARTPMQWDKSEFANFSTHKPWIEVNSNYEKINVNTQEKDTTSILNYYKKLIQLRKSEQVLIDGNYEPYLLKNRHFYVYTRNLENETCLVIGNYSHKKRTFKMPKKLENMSFKLILTNIEHSLEHQKYDFEPYEVRVYQKR
jgi:oligo-1,6-glucosidase